MVRSKRANENVRLLRVGENLRHALAEILAREEVPEPALKGRSITVSAVEVSPDLRHADVYVLPLLGENSDAVLPALNRQAGAFQRALGRRIRLKYIPRPAFKLDPSFAEADRIESLLKSEKVRRDLDDGD